MKLSKKISEISAFNYSFFNGYLALAYEYDYRLLGNEQTRLSKIAELFRLNKVKEIPNLINNIHYSIEFKKNNYVPFLAKAHDCLLLELDGQIENEEFSYSYENLPLPQIERNIKDAHENFESEIFEYFKNTVITKEIIKQKKENIDAILGIITTLDLNSEMVYDELISGLMRVELLDYTPLEYYDNPRKDNLAFLKELKVGIYKTAKNLSYKSIDDLKDISLFEYYLDIIDLIKKNEEARSQNAQKKI